MFSVAKTGVAQRNIDTRVVAASRRFLETNRNLRLNRSLVSKLLC